MEKIMRNKDRNRIMLTAALDELAGDNRGRWRPKRRRQRAIIREAVKSEYIMDLVALEYEQQINDAVGEENVPIGGPVLPGDPALGDGKILDAFGRLFKYLVDNQDGVVSFIEAIFKIFSTVG